MFGTLTMYRRQEITFRKAHSVVTTNLHKKTDESPGAWCGKVTDDLRNVNVVLMKETW